MSVEATVAADFKDWQARGLDPSSCPIRNVLDRIGEKWTMLTLASLAAQPRRFSEFQRINPDISKRMLTQTLRSLERDGLVTRHVFPTKPPSVEYRLSPLGLSILGPLAALTEWAAQNFEDVKEARAKFDAQTSPSPKVLFVYSGSGLGRGLD